MELCLWLLLDGGLQHKFYPSSRVKVVAGVAWQLFAALGTFLSPRVVSRQPLASPTLSFLAFCCTDTIDLFQLHPLHHIIIPPDFFHAYSTLCFPTVMTEAHRHFVATSVQSGVDVSRVEKGRKKTAVLHSTVFQ